MKYCDNCGAKLEDKAKFCDECGTPQEVLKIQKDGSKEKNKKKHNKIPYIILCTILLCVIGGAYYFAIREKGQQKETKNEQTEVSEKQEEKSLKDRIVCNSDEKSEENNVNFKGKLEQHYEAEDIGYPAVITVSNQNGNIVDVNINIMDGTYDITYYGMITSDSIIQISLDGGEKVNLMWEDETTFNVFPADGFSDESVRMARLLCQSLNHVAYKAVDVQKKSNIKAVQPPSGIYWEGDAVPEFANYYVEVSNVTDKGFDFVIYGRNSQNDSYDVVFMPHTAEYTDTYTAVYNGQEYTLTFQWQEPGYMTVTGFEERIPSGSSPLYNNAYLGVS